MRGILRKGTVMVTITIYSKKDCHLCDTAREKLRELQKEFPFSLTEIDIEENASAFEQYKYLIPVITVEGEEVCHYRVNEIALKEVLRRLQSR